MNVQLPQAISAYYEADQGDSVSVAQCFAEDATVIDEGNTYIGYDAIRDWKIVSSKKYTYTVEPFAIDQADDKVVVTAHVVGNFPGSPVDLRYFFGLSGDKIASLEVKP
ncbi:nuclear transport factor 2 family protein [Neorhizobium galegae]|uniref:Nuclear transport factor 2 family protein n=1 Tax=Neorhizobium galegae TaxID=399 RepID=A0A6A1TM47_NEOGA|nr:nuclear transport factor 2 family protein [Neorhizobium galegae]KAB1085368.1 nuclear transport factor 2 family protein [Neorhizobium galegae]